MSVPSRRIDRFGVVLVTCGSWSRNLGYTTKKCTKKVCDRWIQANAKGELCRRHDDVMTGSSGPVRSGSSPRRTSRSLRWRGIWGSIRARWATGSRPSGAAAPAAGRPRREPSPPRCAASNCDPNAAHAAHCGAPASLVSCDVGGPLGSRGVAGQFPTGQPPAECRCGGSGVAADAHVDALDQAEHLGVGVHLDDLGVGGPVLQAVLGQGAERAEPGAQSAGLGAAGCRMWAWWCAGGGSSISRHWPQRPRLRSQTRRRIRSRG